jgi:excisionase family DNA binding protein
LFLQIPGNMSDKTMRPAGERSVLILEAAGVLGVSRRTVYYRIREGRLQTIRTRGGSQRVLWSSIEALLRSTIPQAPPTDSPEPDPVDG